MKGHGDMKIDEKDMETLKVMKAAFERWDDFDSDCDESIAYEMNDAYFGTILRACSLLSPSLKNATQQYIDWSALSDKSMSYYDYDSDSAHWEMTTVKFSCDDWLRTGDTESASF